MISICDSIDCNKKQPFKKLNKLQIIHGDPLKKQ